MIKQTNTILEYLESEFSTFDKLEFNEIDALILSQLCYLNLGEIVPPIKPALGQSKAWKPISELYKAEYFEKMIDKTLTPELNLQLIRAICASPRFREVSLNYFVNVFDVKSEEQFCAVTYLLPNNMKVIAFRGTDLSVIGWKEDFNMFFISPIPSQKTAVKYLEKVAKKTQSTNLVTDDIIITGHSKGGNLAVYSNAFCKKSIHKRVKSIYNLDGPDFPNDILENTDYISEQNKIIKIVPEGSIIGVMFENKITPKIIKSHNIGFLQHDPFSWKCDTSTFVESTKFIENINYLDKTLNAFIYDLEVNERKIIVDTVFDIINVLNIESLDEFAVSAVKEREQIIKALKNVDEKTSAFIKEILKRFITISFKIRFDNIHINKLNTVTKFIDKMK